MKPMNYLLTATLIAGAFCTAGAHAQTQERTVTGTSEGQTSWSALKTVVAGASSQAEAAGTRVNALNLRLDAYNDRITTASNTLVTQTNRLDSVEDVLDIYTDQIGALYSSLSEIEAEQKRQKDIIQAVLDCSGQEKFYYDVTGQCFNPKNNVTDPAKPLKKLVTRTFNIGLDCGGMRCSSTGATSKKLCTHRGYTDVRGTPPTNTLTASCGGKDYMKRWSTETNDWDLVTVFGPIRFGDNGCMGGGGTTGRYITSITCYRYE